MRLKLLSFLFLGRKFSPITIFPGFGGSVIYSNFHESQRVLWPPKVLDLVQYPQYFYNLGCQYKNNTFILNTDSCVGSIGSTEGILSVDKWIVPLTKHSYFDDLIISLKNFYCPDCIYGSPYDFRILGNKDYRIEYYKKLKFFFENKKRRHGDASVIISHSLGGIVVHDFLSKQTEEWKKKFIKKVIFINCPWGGSISALKLLLNEKLQLKNWNTELSIPFIKYYSSLLLLIPNAYFNPNKIIYRNWKKEQVQIHEILEYWNQNELLQNYHHHFDDMLESLQKHNGVEYHVIVGSKLATPSSLYENKETLLTKSGNGDGVIEMESLLACEKWNTNNVRIYILENEEHTTILKSNSLFRLIEKMIQ